MPLKEKLMIDLLNEGNPKTAERPVNITSILNNFKSLMKKVCQEGCTHKVKKKKDEKNDFRAKENQS